MPLIHRLFNQQAKQTPDSIAIIFGSESLTYSELDTVSDAIANRLAGAGVTVGDCVPIFLNRSFELIAGAIGILKAGAAYVPVDTNYPKKRIETMLTKAQARVILTELDLQGLLPATNSAIIDCKSVFAEQESEMKSPRSKIPNLRSKLRGIRRASRPPSADLTAIDEKLPSDPVASNDECSSTFKDQKTGNQLRKTDFQSPPQRLDPIFSPLAYVIFTSGSTGEPKGVAMPHGALANLLEWQQSTLPTFPSERILQFTSISFDVSFQEIFSTLCYGGTLVLIDEITRRDPKALWSFIDENRIERLFIPFVALNQLAEVALRMEAPPQCLRHIITAGEQLKTTRALRELFRHLSNARLHNHYGPSETHVVTAFSLPANPANWDDLPPIGRCIDNCSVLFLDAEGQPAPPEEGGELYFAGACLADGYYQRTDLTVERFIEIDGRRYYRTGDLGKLRPDGEIQYLGRIDTQVKIRGHRVELGEIETVLAQHPNVRDAAVVADDRNGETRLIAFVEARNGTVRPEVKELRLWVSKRLAEYMVPSRIEYAMVLPLTPSGKVDRNRLLEQIDKATIDSSPPTKYVAPSPGLESKIAMIWEGTLGRKWINRTDNFFDVGGTSISIVVVRDLLENELGESMAVAKLFQYPTIAELAKYMESQISGTAAKATLIKERANRQRAAMQRARARRGRV